MSTLSPLPRPCGGARFSLPLFGEGSRACNARGLGGSVGTLERCQKLSARTRSCHHPTMEYPGKAGRYKILRRCKLTAIITQWAGPGLHDSVLWHPHVSTVNAHLPQRNQTFGSAGGVGCMAWDGASGLGPLFPACRHRFPCPLGFGIGLFSRSGAAERSDSPRPGFHRQSYTSSIGNGAAEMVSVS